ncbi:MAG: hypothetical protein AABX83_03860 [Nanoarchaeota archaeon]
MAFKTKTREISIVDNEGTFNYFFRKIAGDKQDYDFNSLSMLRKLFSNQKARLLHVIKTKKPNSVYQLAKILNRDIKSVNEDIKLLDKFGLIELISEKTGNRERLRPVILTDSVHIDLKI